MDYFLDYFTGPILFVSFILWFCACLVVANTWRDNGFSYGAGFASSFFFSPLFGVLLGILVSLRKPSGDNNITAGKKDSYKSIKGYEKAK